MGESIMDALYKKHAKGRIASIKIVKELQLCSCDAVWTDAGVTVVASADAAVLREGAASAKLHIEDAFVPGDVGYGDTPDALNIATGGYNYMAYEVRSSVVRALGDFTIGLDEDAAYGSPESGGRESEDIPAIPVADTWYTVLVPLTAGQMALTSVDSVGITAVVDPGHTDLYIDNIRLLQIEITGDVQITLPTLHTFGNDGTQVADLFLLPFESELISSTPMPVAVESVPFWREGLATEADYGDEQGHAYLDVLDYWDNEPRKMIALGLLRDGLGVGDEIALEVVE